MASQNQFNFVEEHCLFLFIFKVKMAELNNHTSCLYCSSLISGRSDKKFCDSQCRSSYHHKNNNKDNLLIRSINKRLKKNRRILALFKDKGEEFCTAYQLLYSGYDFSLHTSIKISENGQIAYYCYDHGYLTQDNEELILLKEDEKE